jgi:hypothetical protein
MKNAFDADNLFLYLTQLFDIRRVEYTLKITYLTCTCTCSDSTPTLSRVSTMLGFKSAYDLQKSVTVYPFCCATVLSRQR